MESISGQIGGRIRQYRKHAGLTQEALALSSGINVSFLGDVERGIKKPSIETLEKLLKALNVSFREFFDFETEKKPFEDRAALERLAMELKGRSDDEVAMLLSVIKQILAFDDR
jgi:transcriptional regulator with XRE-family HTH domain